MLHDVAANEKLDDSEDAGLEDDEDVDGEEDGADRLHAVHHGGPHYGQHEDQDPHHLAAVDFTIKLLFKAPAPVYYQDNSISVRLAYLD